MSWPGQLVDAWGNPLPLNVYQPASSYVPTWHTTEYSGLPFSGFSPSVSPSCQSQIEVDAFATRGLLPGHKQPGSYVPTPAPSLSVPSAPLYDSGRTGLRRKRSTLSGSSRKRPSTTSAGVSARLRMTEKPEEELVKAFEGWSVYYSRSDKKAPEGKRAGKALRGKTAMVFAVEPSSREEFLPPGFGRNKVRRVAWFDPTVVYQLMGGKSDKLSDRQRDQTTMLDALLVALDRQRGTSSSLTFPDELNEADFRRWISLTAVPFVKPKKLKEVEATGKSYNEGSGQEGESKVYDSVVDNVPVRGSDGEDIDADGETDDPPSDEGGETDAYGETDSDYESESNK